MEWLFKDDDYTPKEDKDAFLNKSIRSVLNLLKKISRSEENKMGFIYELNPLLKFITTIAVIIYTAVSVKIFHTLLILIYIGIIGFFLKFEEIKKIIATAFFAVLFTTIILLPSMLNHNLYNSLNIIIKVFVTISLINVMSYTTKWHEIIKVLKVCCVPDIFIFIVDITIKYLYVLGEIAEEMLYALKLRSLGKNTKKNYTLNNIIGNLFLKSKDYGDEMYSAMVCRGFVGEYKREYTLHLKRNDYIFIAYFVIFTIINFYF